MGWIHKTGAVLPVVVGSAGTEEAFGSKVGLGLRWLPIKIEQGDGLTGGRESFWW